MYFQYFSSRFIHGILSQNYGLSQNNYHDDENLKQIKYIDFLTKRNICMIFATSLRAKL